MHKICLLHTVRAHGIFSNTRSMRYQPIFHPYYFMLHCACILNNVLLTTIIVVEILDGRVRIVRVRYVINNLVIVKYGVISLIVFICTIENVS